NQFRRGNIAGVRFYLRFDGCVGGGGLIGGPDGAPVIPDSPRPRHM
ncbi:hypothetical protein PROFUN_13679, partial [Planoprotostelium fungivorum]